MSDSNSVPVERHSWTKAERQYIKGIVPNYSLQRWSDQDIVNYLQEEKKIKIGGSTVTKIKNQVEQEAGIWYIELKESGSKYVAVYKERLDSLLSYKKKLHDIISSTEKPEVQVRAISELHSIEMSLYGLFKELPQFDIRPPNTHTELLGGCNCSLANGDIISHSKCRYCHQVWCPTTNPECEHGIKGCNYQPYDEHNKWIKCSSCAIWFKNNDILAVHNCYIKVNPKAIEGDDDNLPGIGGEGAGTIIEQPPPGNEPDAITITPYSSPIEEQEPSDIQEPEEEEETESEYYWRTHPIRRRHG
jgi:hypothetical protein